MTNGFIINTDSNAIEERYRRQKEEAQQSVTKKFEFNEKNYLNTKLKEGELEKEIRVRILPISATNGDIFLSLNIHSMKVDKTISKSGFKTYVCLNDEHIEEHDSRGCPFCNKSKEIFNEANAEENPAVKKELIKQAYSYMAKRTYIVRVIERGKEDEGVKFWRFNDRTDGLGIYDKLMKLAKQRKEEAEKVGQENYSIFDLYNGKDITITLKYVPPVGKAPAKTSIDIMDSGFQTPLSTDVDEANKWICDEKTWRDVYALKPYEYLEVVSNGGIPVFDSNEQKWVKKVDNSTYDGTTASDKQQEIEDIEKIFNEKPAANNVSNDDDLPF